MQRRISPLFLSVCPSVRPSIHPSIQPSGLSSWAAISPVESCLTPPYSSCLSVWSLPLMVQTTDESSHAEWEFNCRQFLRIMGPSVLPYAKGKKNPSFPSPPPSLHCNPKLNQKCCYGFLAEASVEPWFIVGTFWGHEPGKAGVSQRGPP